MKSLVAGISRFLCRIKHPMSWLRGGQKIHAQHLKSGTPVGEASLVHVYLQSESVRQAVKLFDETPDWDIVSATSIIGVFTRHDYIKEAVYLFSRLLALSISPNDFTFSTVIHACTRLLHFDTIKQLHACATKMGLQSNVFVGSSLLDSYAKLGSIQEAEGAFADTQEPNVVSHTTLLCGYLKNGRSDDALDLFRRMSQRNVVSWNAIISGFSQTGQNEEAVNLFVEMCREGIRPNESTFPCVFAAAADIAALGMGRSFHGYAIKLLVMQDIFVVNSIISFYAKCGSMEDSLLAFDKLSRRNIVSWNALVGGYAQNGRGEEALQFFRRMCQMGIKPNSVTLLCVLFACNHAGLIDEGYSVFNQTRREEPSVLRAEHYACMVDMLSRSGRFEEARKYIEELPFDPGIGFWKALISGSHIHSNTELVKFAASNILSLYPEDSSSYVLLSNVYSAVGSWQNVSMIRKEMKKKGIIRVPGCSWIEIRNKIHIFVNGDRRHIEINEIHSLLRICFEHLNGSTNHMVEISCC